LATNSEDDRRLTAYLDDELDARERAALDARLTAEPALRARLEALRQAADRNRATFAALLESAPVAEMKIRLEAALAARTPPAKSTRSRSAFAIAAAAAIVAFAAGLWIGRWSGAPGEVAGRDDWRQSVVETMALDTADSFGSAPSLRLAEDVATLSQRLDAQLDVDRLQLDGLSLRRAELLQFDGSPLGQIGYLDGATPVAFCIVRDGEADAPLSTGTRDGFAVASWAQGGRGFMLIGKIPIERLTALARSLKEKTG
jgi:anti-sigma factor RsiW